MFNLLEIVAHFHNSLTFLAVLTFIGAVACGYLGSPGRNANRTGRFLAHEIKYDRYRVSLSTTAIVCA